jgi:WD40 repeat protein
LSTLDHDDSVGSAVFSPEGHILATTSIDKVQLWDVTDPRQPTPKSDFIGIAGPIVSAVFSPDGHTLVVGGGGAIRLWDVTNPDRPTEIGALPGDSTAPPVFSPDGRTLATLNRDQAAVEIWDVTSPRQPTETAVLTGHAGPTAGAVFSLDSHTLAAFGTNGTITLWNVANPRRPAETAILTGNDGVVMSAAFSPDGQALATANHGYSQLARIWEISAERIEARACADPTLPPITRAKWDRYFPGLPFQPPCA